ncbi:helix-turn-helix domain-containing protein [Rhodopseudomonas pseudopalustris]|uniref:helix-turn-helix domain-containing protein n=1 Tax=Rhodopseudomonas pseudopalustris TaxID=1513892 RepID=UPI003D323AA9
MSDAEAAARLNKTVGQIRRLRHKGKLGYLPGRPVLIGEDDIEAYLRNARCRPSAYGSTTIEASTPVAQRDIHAEMDRRVRRAKLKAKSRSAHRVKG